jgi:hypothetical protein
MTTNKSRDNLSGHAIDLLKDHAGDALTYLGIVVTFGVASLICSVIWLLAW